MSLRLGFMPTNLKISFCSFIVVLSFMAHHVHEAEEMRWLPPNEIVNLRMPPADEPILAKLRKESLL